MIDLLAENILKVQEHLIELGWLKREETLTDLTSPGAGNMNRTLRARIQDSSGGAHRTLILKQAVPFVSRYPDIAAPVERGETEATFYRTIANESAIAAMMPKLLATDPENHLLCLTDLGEGQDCTYLYGDQISKTFNPRPLTNWLSSLHSLSDVPRIDNLAMRRLNHEHIFVVPLVADNGVELTGQLKDLQIECANNAHLGKRAEELGARYLDTTKASVLLHGDFYPGSWVEQTGAGLFVVDPEFTFTGPAEFDAGVMLAHLTMTGIATDIEGYTTQPGFSHDLVHAFAGMEVIRRLFGVAQLPFEFAHRDETETKSDWIRQALEWLQA
jgi:5-methylthioribose kinase